MQYNSGFNIFYIRTTHLIHIRLHLPFVALRERIIRGVTLVLLWRESVSLYTFSSSFTIVAAYHTLYNTVIIPDSLRSRNRSRFFDTTTSIFILRSRFFSTSCNRLSNTFWSEKKSRRRKTSRTKQLIRQNDSCIHYFARSQMNCHRV